MSNSKLWDYWSKHYERLWVQKYSLKPTRKITIDLIKTYNKESLDILDIGCGTGQLISDIRQNFKNKSLNLKGLDYSKGMIEKARKNIDYADFILKDISDINSLDNKFDIITCTHSLPYYANQQKAISDMSNLLKKDGILIIACGSSNTVYDKFAFSLVKLTTGFAKYPSIKNLKYMTKDNLELLKIIKIKEKFFMPTIIVSLFKKNGDVL